MNRRNRFMITLSIMLATVMRALDARANVAHRLQAPCQPRKISCWVSHRLHRGGRLRR